MYAHPALIHMQDVVIIHAKIKLTHRKQTEACRAQVSYLKSVCVRAHVCVRMCVCVCLPRARCCPRRPKEGVVSPRSCSQGSCELPGVCARKKTQILCESNKPLAAEPSRQLHKSLFIENVLYFRCSKYLKLVIQSFCDDVRELVS